MGGDVSSRPMIDLLVSFYHAWTWVTTHCMKGKPIGPFDSFDETVK